MLKHSCIMENTHVYQGLSLNVLSENQVQTMLSVYCLTGCDTTSGMFGKGKKTVFNQWMQNSEEYTTLQHLGRALELSGELRRSCCKFIASLYGKKDCLSLSSLRAEKAKLLKLPQHISVLLYTAYDVFINCKFYEML